VAIWLIFRVAHSLRIDSDMLVVRALKIGHMADAGRIQTTLQSNLGKITAENIKRAHALIERGRSIGKIVLAGF
jgi:hypothetical protein